MRFKNILVAYDGSAGSERALQVATSLAHDYGAELCVLSVEEQLPHYAATVGEMDAEKIQANHYFEQLGERAAEQAALAGVVISQYVLPGQPAKTILSYAEEGHFDLLVIGRSGHSNTWGHFMGTTTDKVTRHAPCSVLVVK
jgi:nucleotide-binding universal stress UspA family protein